MGRNISNFKSVPLLENILFLFFYFLNFPTYFFFAIIESYSNNKKLKQNDLETMHTEVHTCRLRTPTCLSSNPAFVSPPLMIDRVRRFLRAIVSTSVQRGKYCITVKFVVGVKEIKQDPAGKRLHIL